MIKQENSGCYKMENRKDNFDKFMSGEDMFSDDNSADDFDRSGDYSEGFSYDPDFFSQINDNSYHSDKNMENQQFLTESLNNQITVPESGKKYHRVIVTRVLRRVPGIIVLIINTYTIPASMDMIVFPLRHILRTLTITITIVFQNQ